MTKGALIHGGSKGASTGYRYGTIDDGAVISNAKSEEPVHNPFSASILSRRWKHVCGAAWIHFILFQLFVGYDRMYSETPYCPHNDADYGDVYWYSCFGCFGGFVMIWFVLLFRIFSTETGYRRVPYYVAFNIVTMGTSATFLSLFLDWGGVCIDVLNVASPAAIWGEWLACGPLLIFITLTIVDKPDLSWMDWFLMVTFYLCLITGYFIVLPQSHASGVFWLVVSCVTYLPVLYLPIYVLNCADVTTDGDKIGQFAEGYAKRYNLAIWLTIVLPLYTVNYLAAMFGYLDPALTILIYQVLSVFTKGLFAAGCMDMHLEILAKTERALVEEKRANDARRAFMKYIFHEVRTPLNSLSMGIEFLETSSSLDENEKDSVLNMKEAAYFMRDTLNYVLSMQKIEEGKLELEMVPFSMPSVISKVVATFQGGVTSKKISLDIDISPFYPKNPIVGDKHRIEHVISNLLSNAIKFSPHGSKIRIAVTCVANASTSTLLPITVEVTDQGCGIEEQDQAKLFNNFVQIRPGKLQEGKGSGLGLCFCKEILKLHGGSIICISDIGKGSTFSFTVPFEIASEAAAEELAQPAEMKLPPRPANLNFTPPIAANTGSLITRTSEEVVLNVEELNVLVVDDSASNRKMLSMLLKRGNVVHELAENGQVCVDMVTPDLHKFKLILMDNLMPVLDGVQATKKLRSMGFPYFIVGITGNVMDDDVSAYLDSGADAVLLKPVKLSTLEMLLKHVEIHGSISKPNMRLQTTATSFEWAPWK